MLSTLGWNLFEKNADKQAYSNETHNIVHIKIIET